MVKASAPCAGLRDTPYNVGATQLHFSTPSPIREYNQERRQITSHRNDGWMADIMLRSQGVILALQLSVQLTVPLG